MKTFIKTILVILALALLARAAMDHFPALARIYYPYRFRDVIEKNAELHGIDPLLVAAVIRVESRFHPEAESEKGALGLMQIMPSTAEWIAEQVGVDGFTTGMLLDPETNIRFGCWYLASLSKEFNGRLPVVIASYNGGRGHVSRWLAEGTWSGEYADRAQIPFGETRHFLTRVWRTYRVYKYLYE